MLRARHPQNKERYRYPTPIGVTSPVYFGMLKSPENAHVDNNDFALGDVSAENESEFLGFGLEDERRLPANDTYMDVSGGGCQGSVGYELAGSASCYSVGYDVAGDVETIVPDVTDSTARSSLNQVVETNKRARATSDLAPNAEWGFDSVTHTAAMNEIETRDDFATAGIALAAAAADAHDSNPLHA